MSPLTTTKADVLFLFVNEMKWGAHGRKSFMESLNVKSGPNVIAGLKCKVQNNKKKEMQTSVTSTTKADQER